MKKIKSYLKGALALTLVMGALASCSDDETTIVVPPPADPTGDFTSVAADLEVTFTATAQNAVSYAWDFGDGETSDLPNPVHTYAAKGTYTVELTITGETGSTPAMVSHDVTVVGPYVAITVVNDDFAALTSVGWDNPESDVPGWKSVNGLDDCGVFAYDFEGLPDNGSTNYGKLRHTDGAVYNLTDHVIAEGDQFKVTVDCAGLYWGDGEIRLYYDTGDGTRNVIATKEYTPYLDAGNQDKVWISYELTVTADAAAAGSKIGIEIENTGNDGGDGWSAVDNVKLWVR